MAQYIGQSQQIDRENYLAQMKILEKKNWIERGLENPEYLDELLKIRRKQGVKDSRFDLNLAEGQSAEKIIDDVLRGGKTVEVKLDEVAPDSGNLLVEYAKGGKPSGISVTEADWYAFVLGGRLNRDVAIFVKTERLKMLLDLYGRTNSKSGTGDKSNFLLVPIDKVVK